MSEAAAQASNPYARPPEAVREPPVGFWPTVRFLGPSFILIGSIVGSGELILTTSMGAQVGFAALWFITLSCLCKTIVQAELGRHTISTGDTCLEAFNRLPGPRYRVSWFVWLWLLWQIPSIINGAGILGSTGQVLDVAFPGLALGQETWAVVIAVFNVLILLYGRYRFLEQASTFMVISFSFITVFSAVALQYTTRAVPASAALEGLQFQIAPLLAPAGLAIVVSSFAATGVSGGELMAYTYWCVEKGYARYAGPTDDSESWVRRALGWIRVMHVDVWLATVVFTASTIAFFWLGAGILRPMGLEVQDREMISTLQHIYTVSLGKWAAALFLVGGFFVLYSTIFSGTAGTGRIYADALCVLKLVDFGDFKTRMYWIRFFTVLVPALQALLFLYFKTPKSMIVFGAVTNGLLIPVIAFSTIWLRYHSTDKRIQPGRLSDLTLWLCAFIILSVSLLFILLQFPWGKALFGAG